MRAFLRTCLCVLLSVAVAWSGLPLVCQTVDGGRDQVELRRVIHTLQGLAGEDHDFADRFAGLLASLQTLAGQATASSPIPAADDASKISVVVRCHQYSPQQAIDISTPPAARIAVPIGALSPIDLVSDIPTPPPRLPA